MPDEKRTFVIVDDASENFYVARFTRTKNQVKPHLWALGIGEYLPITSAYGEPTTRAYSREN